MTRVASRYFIRPDYQENLTPTRYIDPDSPIVHWQVDVYRLARMLVRGTLIDVGCGKGHKLAPDGSLWAPRVIGLDHGAESIAYCQAHYPAGEWIQADFERDEWAMTLGTKIAGAVVVCADVIEHLVDPELLLRNLVQCLDFGAAYLLISTPERVISKGATHLGPPPNLAHVREWSITEFERLLTEARLVPNVMLLTRRNSRSIEWGTILAVVRKERE